MLSLTPTPCLPCKNCNVMKVSNNDKRTSLLQLGIYIIDLALELISQIISVAILYKIDHFIVNHFSPGVLKRPSLQKRLSKFTSKSFMRLASGACTIKHLTAVINSYCIEIKCLALSVTSTLL